MTIGIDTSALLSYYQLKAGIVPNLTGSGTGASASTPPAPTPPWNTTPTAAQTNALVTAALDGAQIINPNATKINVAGASPNYKNLFALYQGLSTLKDLAAQAAKPGESTGQLAQLQAAFANGLAQVQTYLGPRRSRDSRSPRAATRRSSRPARASSRKPTTTPPARFSPATRTRRSRRWKATSASPRRSPRAPASRWW
jgi:hypothetical protein